MVRQVLTRAPSCKGMNQQVRKQATGHAPSLPHSPAAVVVFAASWRSAQRVPFRGAKMPSMLRGGMRGPGWDEREQPWQQGTNGKDAPHVEHGSPGPGSTGQRSQQLDPPLQGPVQIALVISAQQGKCGLAGAVGTSGQAARRVCGRCEFSQEECGWPRVSLLKCLPCMHPGRQRGTWRLKGPGCARPATAGEAGE